MKNNKVNNNNKAFNPMFTVIVKPSNNNEKPGVQLDRIKETIGYDYRQK